MSTLQTAKINGITMRYDVRGPSKAPTVVLHHPLATNLSFWDELVAVLATDHRVIRFDARGHGASEAPTGRYAFETLAADVVSLLDHVNVAKAAFVGLSMGGMVGQYLGLLHADRFDRLAIVSSTSRIAPELRPLWRDRVGVAREHGMVSQVEPALSRWITAANRSSRPDLVARFSRMIETTPLEGYAGWCGAIEQLDITARLGAITLPVRVIVGADDPATPPAASEAIHQAIPGSDLVVLPAVSHMLSAENPTAFHASLLPFLSPASRS